MTALPLNRSFTKCKIMRHQSVANHVALAVLLVILLLGTVLVDGQVNSELEFTQCGRDRNNPCTSDDMNPTVASKMDKHQEILSGLGHQRKLRDAVHTSPRGISCPEYCRDMAPIGKPCSCVRY
ncbi:hypothetical protein BS78_06G035500 [Paspalum vaginatum]|nr:hypothetical protein BS78_06G035500 [Paspalum vaginatum]